MSPHEKLAWINLTIVGLSIALYLVLLGWIGPLPAFGAFGFLGFTGITPFLGRKLPQFDERDRMVQIQAQVIGYAVFWLAFVLGTMGLWSAFRSHGTISVNVLPLFPLAGFVILTLAQSLAIVVQYRRGR